MNPEYPKVASHEEWLVARRQLLEQEKALTHQLDALNVQRRALPMVEVTADYRFTGPEGEVGLAELFAGRRQLIVYHFMFHRDKGEGCPGCSFLTDNIGHPAHLHARDTNLVLVSNAPLAELEAFKQRMGWKLPWYSSFGSRFNYDFHVTIDASQAPVEYNYQDEAELKRMGQLDMVKGELPGASVFLRDGERVFHTYSTYARGLDILMSAHHFLDLTPFGRGEGWDGMANLEGKGLNWVRLHDQYDGAKPTKHDCCA
ncbi:DUF899 domain-containing protein [Pseudomonas sp. Gutcm_11s]|uniref:DUF899 domain-containing protein n=1 Tax=Pseudomonas sp. Gutcm_11s TaxID=3026088 RepID=UPI0023614D1E|nr:DUF899 domain-containing protein [Pseudomonas sp. Gutcm_11s]MDD0844595.1 DUF899 domain-containing protein [Pseudomonas sp. Gutcm_11s]